MGPLQRGIMDQWKVAAGTDLDQSVEKFWWFKYVWWSSYSYGWIRSKCDVNKSDEFKTSSTGPTEGTPKKPEYLIALATYYLGVRWSGPIHFFDEIRL